MPANLSFLAWAYAEVGQFEDARRAMDEARAAAETAKESWFEGQLPRRAGAIALKSPPAATAQAQTHFERALAVAREPQAKSSDLRTAMSAALWRDPGNNRIPMVFSPASLAGSPRASIRSI